MDSASARLPRMRLISDLSSFGPTMGSKQSSVGNMISNAAPAPYAMRNRHHRAKWSLAYDQFGPSESATISPISATSGTNDGNGQLGTTDLKALRPTKNKTPGQAAQRIQSPALHRAGSFARSRTARTLAKIARTRNGGPPAPMMPPSVPPIQLSGPPRAALVA